MGNLGNKETMAKNIKRYMELTGINQTELCQALGFKFMTVSDWVNAKTYPRIDKIEMMANYFGVSKADLVEEPGWDNVQPSAYTDPATEELVQALHDRPDLAMVFRAAKDVSPEDLQQVVRIIETFKKNS